MEYNGQVLTFNFLTYDGGTIQVVMANGSFDANGGTIDFTSNIKIVNCYLLGDDADMYDGSKHLMIYTIILTISTAGTKTVSVILQY